MVVNKKKILCNYMWIVCVVCACANSRDITVRTHVEVHYFK